MILRKCLIGTGIALVAFGPIACSSDSDTAKTESTTSAAAAAQSSDAHDPAAPTSQQLQDTLTLLVDPAKSADEKAAAVVNGSARVENFKKMTAAVAHYPVTFKVGDVVMNGHNADALVDVGSPHGSMPMPMTWEDVDGKWKLSDGSSCKILDMGKAPCQ